MADGPKIAHVAALVGDPARANMLSGLWGGRALTASELAAMSGVSPPTASGHLAKLLDAGLLAMERQGRHRYYRLASPQVGQMLEALALVAQDGPARAAPAWRGGEALRHARTCYDHMAGRVAVSIADGLVARGCVSLDADGGVVTEAGHRIFAEAGIAIPDPPGRRVFCRPCLDWSERRPHVAGVVGAALLRHALQCDWVRRIPGGRALSVTPAGTRGLATAFGLPWVVSAA